MKEKYSIKLRCRHCQQSLKWSERPIVTIEAKKKQQHQKCTLQTGSATACQQARVGRGRCSPRATPGPHRPSSAQGCPRPQMPPHKVTTTGHSNAFAQAITPVIQCLSPPRSVPCPLRQCWVVGQDQSWARLVANGVVNIWVRMTRAMHGAWQGLASRQASAASRPASAPPWQHPPPAPPAPPASRSAAPPAPPASRSAAHSTPPASRGAPPTAHSRRATRRLRRGAAWRSAG